MWLNNLKITFRQLWKHKLLAGINIFGLAAAIAASLLLFLTAFHQFSYDRFHTDGERIFRLYQEEYHSTGVDQQTNMPFPMLPALREELPQLTNSCRWLSSSAVVTREGEEFKESLRYTDPGFFQMFSFPLLAGEAASVLQSPNSVVLNRRSAGRLFGDKDPLGQPLTVTTGGVKLSLTVTGVAEDDPDNSTLDIGGLVMRLEDHPSYDRNRDNWDDYNHDVYLQLPTAKDAKRIEEQLETVVGKYLGQEEERLRHSGATPDAEGEVLRLKLQPLFAMHFEPGLSRDGISKAFPVGLLTLGGLILLIVCINFVNLTLGQSLTRSREVGVRKVLGANRRQLAFQFWTEAMVVTLVSLLGALALAQGLLPAYNSILGQSLALWRPDLLLALALILSFIAFIGGIYPSLVLSRFQAAAVLKGTHRQVERPGRLRNLLVVIQFSLSVLLIICTLIVDRQLQYMREKPLGYNEKEVISIPLSDKQDGEQVLSRLRNELAAQPEIKSITAAYNNLGRGRDGSAMTSVISFSQDEALLKTHWNPVEYDYFNTLEIPIVEGRGFSPERTADSVQSVIINETFARQLGEGPAVGKVLQLDPPHQIVGVVQDYHFRSLDRPIEPISFVPGGGRDFRYHYIFVRVETSDLSGALARLERTWKRIDARAPFEASFLDENTDRLYQAESSVQRLFTGSALLAILLSCMGLFGIATLVIAQRTKEIGIRKVLGASVAQILELVTRDFIWLVLIAIALASPLAWWAMQKWLESYAYRIDFPWWVILVSGVLAIAIALLTLSAQSLRAARLNPVEALRDE